MIPAPLFASLADMAKISLLRFPLFVLLGLAVIRPTPKTTAAASAFWASGFQSIVRVLRRAWTAPAFFLLLGGYPSLSSPHAFARFVATVPGDGVGCDNLGAGAGITAETGWAYNGVDVWIS